MSVLFDAFDAVPSDWFLLACAGLLLGLGLVERLAWRSR